MIPVLAAPRVMLISPNGCPSPAIAAGETNKGRELGIPRMVVVISIFSTSRNLHELEVSSHPTYKFPLFTLSV